MAIKAEKKDYFKVTDLSEKFEAWQNEDPPTSTQVLLWQARFQLCIAQQLTVISQHLGKIVQTAQEQEESRVYKETRKNLGVE